MGRIVPDGWQEFQVASFFVINLQEEFHYQEYARTVRT